MGTRGYLQSLDLDQLRHARDVADQLIRAKEAEGFVPIWVVANDCVNVAAYPESDYQKAVDRARLLVDEEAKSGLNFVVRVDRERRRESEVADMLALGDQQ